MKWSNEETVVNRHRGHVPPRLTDASVAQMLTKRTTYKAVWIYILYSSLQVMGCLDSKTGRHTRVLLRGPNNDDCSAWPVKRMLHNLNHFDLNEELRNRLSCTILTGCLIYLFIFKSFDRRLFKFHVRGRVCGSTWAKQLNPVPARVNERLGVSLAS